MFNLTSANRVSSNSSPRGGRVGAFFILITVCTSLFAANNVTLRKQKNLAKWDVVGANYSGITHIGGTRYAVVDDKDEHHAFRLFDIDIDEADGKIRNVVPLALSPENRHWGENVRDAEGIAFCSNTNSVFVSAENDQRIVEHTVDGVPTGRELAVPASFGREAIYGNYGFEALAYSEKDHCLWTTTEHTLKADGNMTMPGDTTGCMLRLVSFDDKTMKPLHQYAYRMDAPRAKKKGRNYAYGVSALCSLDDGSLLVLEREFYVAKRYLGSWVQHRIYRVVPSQSQQIESLHDIPVHACMNKTLVAQFRTRLNVTRRNLANYEGMCLGPRLADGSQTLILISDSQKNHGNGFYRMKDYIKVIVLCSDKN